MISSPRHLVRLACVLLVWMGAGCSNEPVLDPEPAARRWEPYPGTVLHVEEDFYWMRRAHLALLAWAESLGPTPVGDPITVVHFGSSIGLSPAPAPPADFRPQDAEDWIPYLYSLSPEHYLTVACYLGWVDEIYWVQPELAMFSGAVTVAAFDIADDNGQLVFSRAAGEHGSAESSERGVPTERRSEAANGGADRFLPVAIAQDLAESRWRNGSLRLHGLGLDQFDALVEEGRFTDQPVWVNVDLDYFGARSPLRLHGPLLFHDVGSIATGIDGAVLPIFAMSTEPRRDLVRRVGSLVQTLRPWRTAMIESPDRVFRKDLPSLASEVRRSLRGRSANVEFETRVSRLDVEVGERRVELDPGRTRVLLAPAEGDTMRLGLFLSEPLEESLYMSLHFDPRSSRDQRVALWRFDPGNRNYGVTLPFPRDARALQPGWDVEIRSAVTGLVYYSAEFAVLGEQTPFNQAVSRFFENIPDGSGVTRPERAEEVEPNEWVRIGAVHGVPIRAVEDLILSLPQSYRLYDISMDRQLMNESMGAP